MLDQRESILRQIIESIPYRVFWKDRNSVYLGCNKSFAKICGLERPEEIVGITDHMLPWTEEETAFFIKCDREVMDSGEPLLDIVEPQLRPDGSQAILLTSKVPLKDPTGRVFGILGIFTDITERVAIENQLREALTRVEESQRKQNELFANISHELRTPLTLIKGPLETILAEERVSPGVRGGLERVLRNSSRLLFLVNNLLDLAKTLEEEERVDPKPVQINRFVASIVEDALPVAYNRGLDLRFKAAEDLEIVNTDASRVEAILLNLVGNALKFTPPGKGIQVWPTREDPFFVLHVRDQGPGIEAEKQETIFERFSQGDGSSSRKYEGTGIGLALVREMTRHLGGRIELESEPGKGAHFRVFLPINPGLAVGQADEVLCISEREGRFTHLAPAPQPTMCMVNEERPEMPLLLLAEDNGDMRDHIIELLRDQYRILPTADGMAALEAIGEHLPDVVLTDLMMPGMDGMELTGHIKRLHPRIPVLILTAKTGERAVAEGLDMGADDYLSKPFAPNELKARLASALRIRRLIDDLDASHKRLDQTREQLAEQKKLAALGMVTAGIAHELKNPINFITNFSGLLSELVEEASEGELDLDEIRVAADKIRKHADRANRIVDSMSGKSSQAAQAKISVAPTPLLRQAWEIAYEQFRLNHPQFRCKLEMKVMHGPERLPLHEEIFTRVVINLLDNAFYAMAAVKDQAGYQPRIIMELTEEDGWARLMVEDNGPGIDELGLARIFEPFFTTKPPNEGQGLGLYICRRAVTEAHDGRMRVESWPGVATRFIIHLPLAG